MKKSAELEGKKKVERFSKSLFKGKQTNARDMKAI